MTEEDLKTSRHLAEHCFSDVLSALHLAQVAASAMVVGLGKIQGAPSEHQGALRLSQSIESLRDQVLVRYKDLALAGGPLATEDFLAQVKARVAAHEVADKDPPPEVVEPTLIVEAPEAIELRRRAMERHARKGGSSDGKA